jgi:hypothetical protein
MSRAAETRVPCSKATRERLWDAKSGYMTFDELFRQMLAQYDPEEAEEASDTSERLKSSA